MSKKFGVFIGRFQPFHIGHASVIRDALTKVDKLIVLVGSSDQARDTRNPFTFTERREMIRASFGIEMIREELIVLPLRDHPYSDTAWVAEVQQTVADAIGFNGTDSFEDEILLAGYGKDASSYYLKLFPEWGNIQIDASEGTFSATDIRERYFQRIPIIADKILAPHVVNALESFSYTDAFKALLAEKEYLDGYEKQWGRGPFVTADAVVIQSGHILLVRRGDHPGKGLLALPGGFVNPDERVEDGAIRELREETKIADRKGEIPPAMLRSFIDRTTTRVFDDPNRSLRGRIITHAFLFRLPNATKLFHVKGSDDAEHADWYEIGTLKPDMFFEDHWSIIKQMADL